MPRLDISEEVRLLIAQIAYGSADDQAAVVQLERQLQTIIADIKTGLATTNDVFVDYLLTEYRIADSRLALMAAHLHSLSNMLIGAEDQLFLVVASTPVAARSGQLRRHAYQLAVSDGQGVTTMSTAGQLLLGFKPYVAGYFDEALDSTVDPYPGRPFLRQGLLMGLSNLIPEGELDYLNQTVGCNWSRRAYWEICIGDEEVVNWFVSHTAWSSSRSMPLRRRLEMLRQALVLLEIAPVERPALAKLFISEVAEVKERLANLEQRFFWLKAQLAGVARVELADHDNSGKIQLLKASVISIADLLAEWSVAKLTAAKYGLKT